MNTHQRIKRFIPHITVTTIALLTLGAGFAIAAVTSGVDASNTGSGTTIRGERTTPGKEAKSPGSQPSHPKSNRKHADPKPSGPRPDEPHMCEFRGNCWRPGQVPSPAPQHVSSDNYVSAPAVTIVDIASFVPNDASISSEPVQFAIVGLPVNLIAHASQHIVPGHLFGDPADVRYTPVGVHWAFSDGSSSDTSDLGSAWASLGAADFTETATSHRFAATGRAQAAATIRYRAEYRLGSGEWTPISGVVERATPALELTVFAGKSALVGHLCNGGQHVIGCAG